MRFHWLLPSFIGIFLLCAPAQAGKIISWEFEEQDNNLVFITDEGVQPKAQLLSNPTRLVIDLPGTTLGRETVKEQYQGAIRGFRIGQPEPNMSRIVVEFAPGYTIDSDEIQFRGISPTQWTVEIPQPYISRINTARNDDREVLELPQVELPSSLPGLESAEVPRNTTTNIRTTGSTGSSSRTTNTVNSPHIRATKNGFFINIDGNRKIKIDSQRDGDRIDFVLEGITLPTDLASQSVAVNQYGVSTIEFEQVSAAEAKMSLKVAEGSPDWLATFSRIQGLLLVPRGKLPTSTNVATASETSESEAATLEPLFPQEETTAELSQIDEIELTDSDSQLLVQADTELSAVTSRLSNGIYQVTINNAELAEDFQGPELKAGSPISQLKVRQEDSQVVLEVTTRLRYRLGQLSSEEETIALPIEIGTSLPPQNEAPLLPPEFAKAPKDRPFQQPPSLIPASDRPRIIIDPGHGGKDPGTIGIGGFREKDVVLPISLDVAEILRKQGIEVIMTRDSDYFISLQGRTDLANDRNADLFVSIHANAINLSRPDVNGLETYYYKSGRRLAEVIHWSILNGVNIDNRGIRRARFYVLRHSIAPAVLVEVGFLTGADDSSRLKDPNHRRQMAEAIARGIIEYIKQSGI
ncbi:N-acetylmuramoyl-L-alanine amidase [Pleurocapsa sp. PCC 7319]|uniref:N-acetylmuramoyl-L-alanine amidase n=1 Tax=Pleurocapsa sp. PCC 7319 TaxID=118161 RepID=UPI0003481815|nr:N-acetylmuramoyl-L-alanine amidase [Pleurocapsa sp. PCC 7319]